MCQMLLMCQLTMKTKKKKRWIQLCEVIGELGNDYFLSNDETTSLNGACSRE